MSGDHNMYQKDKSYLDFECPRCGHCCYVDADDTSENHVDETAECKHEWVGLTEDECIGLLPVMPYEYEFDVEALLEYTKIVEAKLKEKNT